MRSDAVRRGGHLPRACWGAARAHRRHGAHRRRATPAHRNPQCPSRARARFERVRARGRARRLGRDRTRRRVAQDPGLGATTCERMRSGAPVRKGEALFSVYSPELYAAQAEYLQALQSQKRRGCGDRRELTAAMPSLRAARARLRLWDVSDAEIDALGQAGNAVRGAADTRAHRVATSSRRTSLRAATIEPGARLFRIAPLDRVWIDAQLQESESEVAAVGQNATVSLPFLPGKQPRGQVAYVYPYLRRRHAHGAGAPSLANPGLVLRPDMYAAWSLSVDRGGATARTRLGCDLRGEASHRLRRPRRRAPRAARSPDRPRKRRRARSGLRARTGRASRRVRQLPRGGREPPRIGARAMVNGRTPYRAGARRASHRGVCAQPFPHGARP